MRRANPGGKTWSAPGIAAAAAAAAMLAAGACSASQPDSTFVRDAGPAPVARAAEWETLSTGLPEEARFRRIVRLRYNRVDGPAVTLGAATTRV